MSKKIQLATFGGGCFWCTEAIFQKVKGVEKVVSGYSGGNVPGKPTYREICSGLTGHAEVIPFCIFYEAEQGHQNYYKKNKLQRYCMFVISPKLSKLRRLHKHKLK